jgi:glycosyltransferase involved in cell wall biosynthesis
MRVGIDASNLRLGGGVTHLRELLGAARPARHGVTRVVIWAGARTLAELPARPWLELAYDPILDGPLWARCRWQSLTLAKLARASCDALFVPGGSYAGTFQPFVTMSRNLLPFEKPERDRYGYSTMRVKMLILRALQAATFRRASGLVFLSAYARTVVACTIGLDGRQPIIPHGVGEGFRMAPRRQQPLGAYSRRRPFTLLYPSSVDVYKHQWHVVDAVGRLRRQGLPVALELIGPAYPPALSRLRTAMRLADPEGSFIRYTGHVPARELAAHYHRADGLVFASSCENMPNILLEAMAAGLPIVCSARGPMPEILGDTGTYVDDPERPADMARTLEEWLHDPDRRERHAWSAFERARQYSWARCADATFSYLTEVAGVA